MGILRSAQSVSGFTIIEFLVVMLIVAIIAAIGLPSFKYVTTSNRISTEVNNLLGDMRYARTEALKDGLPVTVCASTNPYTACSTSNSWETGWIVFADPNNTQAMATGQLPLRVQPAFSTAFRSTDTFTADNAFSILTFNREGFGSAMTNPGTPIATVTNNVTMELQSNPVNQAWTRCLVITPIGNLSIATAPGSGQFVNCQ
jgi:type IV fimbrial biogenesis protein FimT